MGFLLVFDVTNESSFLSIRDWLTFIDTYTLIDTNLRPPILLIGNKIDLVTQRTICTIRAQQLANELGITYIETSAVTGTNVQDTLNILIEKIFQFMEESMQKYYPKENLQSSSVKLLSNDNHRRRTSTKIMNKLSKVKKTSCSCT
jgi:Ras-related protein Rab-27A